MRNALKFLVGVEMVFMTLASLAWASVNSDTSNLYLDITRYGAIGDGKTDATASIQAVIDKYFPKYNNEGLYCFYIVQSHPILVIPKGEYRITRTLDMSFRNDMTIMGLGKLVWDGPQDGTVIEAKCCSRCKYDGLKIDGRGKVGTFIHLSGNGTADGNKTITNKCMGKGNVSGNIFEDCWFGWQWPESTRAMLDCIPDPKETPHAWYYSMDDSSLSRCYFQTTGKYGFALAMGSSEVSLVQCKMATPNGIKLVSGNVRMYHTVFTLQASDKGAIYCTSGWSGELELVGSYLENTSAPLINVDGVGGGHLKSINIFGGLYAQNKDAKYFIYVPEGVVAAINIDNPRIQGPLGKVYAPSCVVTMNKVAAGNMFADYMIKVEAKMLAGSQGNAEAGKYLEFETFTEGQELYVTDKPDINKFHFSSIDDALTQCAFTRAGKVKIILQKNETLSRPHIIRGNIEITSEKDKRYLLTVKAQVRVYGQLTLDTLSIENRLNNSLVNDGGYIDLQNISVASPNSAFNLVSHERGNTLLTEIVQVSGGLVDTMNGQGEVVLRDLKVKPGMQAVQTCDSLGNIRVVYINPSIPVQGRWGYGTIVRNPKPEAGGIAEWMCVEAGNPGQWKAVQSLTK
jgi:hypothetical protein